MSTQDDIFEQIRQIIADVLMKDHLVLDPASSAKDFADWDSFRHIEIIMGIEEQFRIKFTTRQIDGLKTVGDLVDCVRHNLARGPG